MKLLRKKERRYKFQWHKEITVDPTGIKKTQRNIIKTNFEILDEMDKFLEKYN